MMRKLLGTLLEHTIPEIEEDLNDIIRIQSTEPSVKTDEYMRGLANGLICARSCVNQLDPVYISNKVQEQGFVPSVGMAGGLLEDAAAELIRLYKGKGWNGAGKEINPEDPDWKALMKLEKEGKAEVKRGTPAGIIFRIL